MKKRLQHYSYKKLIAKSGLFDSVYYKISNPDVKGNGMNPLNHFVKFGANEGRQPNAYFDLTHYIEINSDIKQLSMKHGRLEAFIHFIQLGMQDVKSGSRSLYVHSHRYHQEEYLNENPDVREIVTRGEMTPFEHYFKVGCREINDRVRFSYQVYKADEIYKFKHEILKDVINPESIDPKTLSEIEAPKFDTPLVSIIIPTYNQAQYTHNIINSIINSSPKTPFEIIVMDDNSPQMTAKTLGNQLKNITFISNEQNLGFLQNCNKGAHLAKGNYLLFLNNDTFALPNWLDALVELLEIREDAGMVGSKLIYPEGNLQEAGGIIWDDATGWNYGRLDVPSKSEYSYVKEVDYLSGASIMIRHELWKTVGGFDERYTPAYYEDTDLAYEVRKHGYKVLFQPRSQLIHFEGISHGTDTNNGVKKYQSINHKKFLDKWQETLKKESFENAQDIFVARDRSRDKPHVLFIDHYLPHYDEDAGSKATFQYLKILVHSGMQVHFIGDNYWDYPEKPYLNTLTDMGIEVLYGNHYANKWQEWIHTNGQYFDYAILSRPHIASKYIDIIKAASKAKIIYFGHDLHFLRELRRYEITKNEEYLESSNRWKDIELELIEKSDTTYLFSDVEKSIVEDHGSQYNVDVVPLFIYDHFKKLDYDPSKRQGIMFVGGFAHVPNTDAIKWFVHEVWPLILNKIPEAHFYIIGSKPPKEILDMKSEHITVTGFISDEELEAYYAKCRLVVAPLRFGAGVKGKVVDALYNAVPLVTTSIGAEGIQDAETIMEITDDAEMFAEAVCTLYYNEKALQKLSTDSLNYCKNYFSVPYAKQQMANVITEFERNPKESEK